MDQGDKLLGSNRRSVLLGLLAQQTVQSEGTSLKGLGVHALSVPETAFNGSLLCASRPI